MKPIQVRSTARPEVLELREISDPIPQAGEALVRVHTDGEGGSYHAGPVLVGAPVDYRDNQKLMEIVHPEALN
jgi:hypothetical protein